jgi:hypothetical protein
MTLVAEAQSFDTDAIREYQAQQLGRRDGETALLELYPLPAARLSHWPYASLSDLSVLRDRKTYHKALSSQRIGMIQALIDEHQPRFVVMYGTTYRKQWRQLYGGMLLMDVDAELLCGRRGRTEMLLITHPAAIGITNEYFEAVGRYIGDLRRNANLTSAAADNVKETSDNRAK